MYKININRGSYKILFDLLNSTGWAKTITDIIQSGGVLSRLDEVEIPVTKMTQLEVRAWVGTPVPEFILSEKEREAVKKCLRHHVEAGSLPASASASNLLIACGLME